MPNRRLTRKTIKGKDGVHPGSRKGKIPSFAEPHEADKKADQLARVSLREHKLKGAAKARKELASSKRDSPLFLISNPADS
jgi:translation machinery-associated protein 16